MALSHQESLKGKEANTKVFISYSRKNMDWADWLVEQLTDQGIEMLIDRQDIVPGEAWEPRIYSLIDQADTVIFLISSASVNSGICHQEVDYAESLNKRFVPLLLEDPLNEKGEKTPVPEALQKINYIFFNKGSDPHKSLTDLLGALLVDINWVREHTRIGELSQRWDQAGRPSSQLLRGKDLDAAETWRDHPLKDTRPPTELQLRYIADCRKGAGKRRNMLVGSLVAGLVIAVGLGGLAFWQRGEAIKNEEQANLQRELAQQNAEQANLQKELAKRNEAQANKERDFALTTQSQFLSDLAEQYAKNGDGATAMLLALLGLPDKSEDKKRPYVIQAEHALYAGKAANKQHIILKSNCKFNCSVLKSIFSPDGTKIASIYSNKTVRIVDWRSRRTISTLPVHMGDIQNIIFSPDGNLIATAASKTNIDPALNQTSPDDAYVDPTVRLWETATGKLRAKFKVSGMYQTMESEHQSMSFSPDSKKIVTASRAYYTEDDKKPCIGCNIAQIWDTTSGKRLFYIKGKAGIKEAAFSPDNETIITFEGYSETADVWSAKTGKKINVIRGLKVAQDTNITFASFSSDGKKIVFPTSTNSAQIYQLPTGELDATFTMKYKEGQRLLQTLFSPSGEYLITISQDVQIWHVKTGNLLGSINDVATVSFSPDSKHVVTTGDNKTTIKIWNVATATLQRIIHGHKDRVTDAIFSPDGKNIVTSSNDGTARVWAVEKNTALETLFKAGKNEKTFFNLDRSKIFISSKKKSSRIKDLRTGEMINISLGKYEVSEAQFSPDGTKLAVELFDFDNHILQVWKVKTGQRIINTRGKGRFAVSFSLDSQQITIADGLGLQTKNLKTGKTVSSFKGYNGWKDIINSDVPPIQIFNHKEKTVVINTHNGAGLWVSVSGKLLKRLTETAYSSSIMAVNPSQNLFLFADVQSSSLWDINKNKNLGAFVEEDEPIISADICKDGSTLVTASGSKGNAVVSYNGTGVRIWDLKSGKLLTRLEDSNISDVTVSFNHDCKRIVTSSGQTVRMWQSLTGKLLATFKLDIGKENINSAKSNSEGNAILITTAEGSLLKYKILPDTQQLVDYVKRKLPFCLTTVLMKKFYLQPIPPRWCITGPGNEKVTRKEWKGKWPYNTVEWKGWLSAKDSGKPTDMPNQ